MFTLLSLLLKLWHLSSEYRCIKSILAHKRSSWLIIKSRWALSTFYCRYFPSTSVQLSSRNWTRSLICFLTIYWSYRSVTLAKLLKIRLLPQLAISFWYLVFYTCQECLIIRFLILVDVDSTLSTFGKWSIQARERKLLRWPHILVGSIDIAIESWPHLAASTSVSLGG